jgi:hypothetical protein
MNLIKFYLLLDHQAVPKFTNRQMISNCTLIFNGKLSFRSRLLIATFFDRLIRSDNEQAIFWVPVTEKRKENILTLTNHQNSNKTAPTLTGKIIKWKHTIIMFSAILIESKLGNSHVWVDKYERYIEMCL